jgi:hypothetical protein
LRKRLDYKKKLKSRLEGRKKRDRDWLKNKDSERRSKLRLLMQLLRVMPQSLPLSILKKMVIMKRLRKKRLMNLDSRDKRLLVARRRTKRRTRSESQLIKETFDLYCAIRNTDGHFKYFNYYLFIKLLFIYLSLVIHHIFKHSYVYFKACK